MWPPQTDAAHCAVSGSTPSRTVSTVATASAAGLRSATLRHRDRMVAATSSGCSDGAQSRNTV